MTSKGKLIDAIGYMRTSSATNVGEGKDSEARQRKAIEGYAKSAGFVIVEWFYDKAVRGADAIIERPGFAAMLDRIAGNGVSTILVESPDRFARDLAVQLAGHDHLRKLGVTLIPATAPDFFTEDTPTAVLVRQVLGVIAQFGSFIAQRSGMAIFEGSRRLRIENGHFGTGAGRDPALHDGARARCRTELVTSDEKQITCASARRAVHCVMGIASNNSHARRACSRRRSPQISRGKAHFGRDLVG
jgi:hypothetical protein